MNKSFNGVPVSMPKEWEREAEECIEALIDFLDETTPAPAGSSAENDTLNTSAVIDECPRKNEIVEQLNGCGDRSQPVLFVECPEKERPSALLCAALGWAQQHPLGTMENFQRVVIMGKNLYSMTKLEYAVQETDFANQLQALEEFPHRFFTLEGTKASSVGVFLTTQYAFFDSLMSASSKYQLESVAVEVNKYSLKNTLVIVEDAHMLDEVVRDAASCRLSLCVIENFIKNFENNASTDSAIMKAMEILETLKRLFFRGIAPHRGGENDPSFSLEELSRLLNCTNILEFDFQSLGEERLNDPDLSEILKFLLLLINVLSDDEAVKDKSPSIYRMFTSDACPLKTCKNRSCKSINFMCLDASFVIKKLMKMHPFALILSSASLAPFKYLKAELGISEAKEFVGKSSVEDHQIFARILTCGAGGFFFNSSYNRRFDSDYLNSLGKTIVQIAKVTPPGEGMVIYLSSYEFQDTCVLNWQECAPNKKSVWDTIAEYKDVVAVSKGDASQSHLVTRLNESQKTKGSCVLAVLRSEVSEYTFLPIESRRVVVIVGVPFIPTNQPQVQLKIQYNRTKPSTSGYLNMQFGSDFVRRESYKPIRQVTDHQISSLKDYSVILLLDTRYDEKSLSPWLNDKIIREQRLFELIEELSDFFHLVKNRIQYIQEKKDKAGETATQFGSVPKWEMEKLCLEYKKLKKNNDSQERLRDSLLSQSQYLSDRQAKLEEKLKDPVSPKKRPFPE